eukprot:scaffold65671_cov49-Phaeocystis_antarctica.AAC.1
MSLDRLPLRAHRCALRLTRPAGLPAVPVGPGPWDPTRAATLDNMLFVTTAAAEKHEQLGPQAPQPELANPDPNPNPNPNPNSNPTLP